MIKRRFATVVAVMVLGGCGANAASTETGTAPASSVPPKAGVATTRLRTGSVLPTRTIYGRFTLIEDRALAKGAPCEGPAPYDDLREGAPVIVRNEAGKEIGRGALEPGKASSGTFGGPTHNCEFPFNVTDLPVTASYTISISHAEDQTVSATDLEDRGWNVEFGLAMPVPG